MRDLWDTLPSQGELNHNPSNPGPSMVGEPQEEPEVAFDIVTGSEV